MARMRRTGKKFNEVDEVEVLRTELLHRQQELRALKQEVAVLRRTLETSLCLSWGNAGAAGRWLVQGPSECCKARQIASCGAMAAEYVDPFLKQGFDGDRIRCGGCLGGLLILGSVGSAVPLLFVPIWLNVPSTDLIRWKPLPGRPPPTMTATLFRFDFEKPEWTGTTEVVPGFDWLDFCRYNVNDTLPVAKKLIEGTIFQPDPLEADQQVCIGATYACWLTVLGVLTIAGADLFILLSGLLKSILLLLLGGWLALLSAFALLLALAGLFLVDAKHLGTAPGVILLGSSVAFAFVGTTMALYQAMRATPDHLPKERQKWKEDDEELTEEEEKKRVQQILVECLDYDIPRLERYRVSMHILEECAEEEISYEEWLIEERLRMKTGKSRRAVLTEEELQKATVELRIRRRAHPALAQAINIMVEESRKGRAAGRVPVSVLQEAFQGIDVTLRNRVTTREILAALKVCGIYVEGPAMDDLIGWLYKQEEAKGEQGTLDLPMFVALFNQVTDMLAKEMILKKAARGYQLTCRMAFLMNLIFLCVALLSVTQEGADASWNSLLNVFGILFAIQFWSVIALPMLCSVLGKKAKVWRQHFCLQLLRCLSPLIRLCKRLCLCLCEVLLFIKGCCGLCKLCCGTLEDPDEEKGIAEEETKSEGGRRGSIETGRRGSMESSRSGSRGRRGSMEKQNRRSSVESENARGRRSSMEKANRRSSMEKGSRRGSMESERSTQSQRSNRRSSKESSQGPESQAQRDRSLRISRLSADSGRSSAESYSMDIDDDLSPTELREHVPTTFLPQVSEESGLFGSEGGDSVQSNVFEQIEKFQMERKQVRSPTGDPRDRLRSAGLAFKSEDEVFSYHVGPMRKRKEKDEVKEVEEAWVQPEPSVTLKKKGRRKHRRMSAQKPSSAGSFFRSLVGSKEELTVVKELSINSQQSSASRASRRAGSLSPRSPRLSRRSSRGSLSSGNSGRASRKGSKGSKKGFFQRLLQRRRPSVEEPAGYDPAAYQLAAMREHQMLAKGGPASFSPMQVRNLRAPQMMPPMVLEETAAWCQPP
eukprot:s501_g5.t2